MSDLISRKAILEHIEKIRQGAQMMDDTRRASIIMNGMYLCEEAVRNQPPAQPERKKDIIQKFHDYQVEWLTNHYDLEFEPTLENLVVRFLHDTANCFMMEMDRGEQDG